MVAKISLLIGVRFSAMGALVRHSWPGNIRELRNVVERLFLLGNGKSVFRAWFDEVFASDLALAGEAPLPEARRPIAERRTRLADVLARHDGNKSAAAGELGVTRKTIHKWLRES